MAAINRFFVRCRMCLAVSAIEEHPSLEQWHCGICNAPTLELMGRVERDRLIQEHIAAVCDERCTSARGPLCSCKCGGKHHGSNRVVRVVRDCGPVPLITPTEGREQARINAAEYRALRDALLGRLDPLLARRRAGYLPYSDYAEMRRLQAANKKAAEARTHGARRRILTAVVGYVPADNANPIEAVAEATSGAIATAAPLADAPFSLSPTTHNRAATQPPLF